MFVYQPSLLPESWPPLPWPSWSCQTREVPAPLEAGLSPSVPAPRPQPRAQRVMGKWDGAPLRQVSRAGAWVPVVDTALSCRSCGPGAVSRERAGLLFSLATACASCRPRRHLSRQRPHPHPQPRPWALGLRVRDREGQRGRRPAASAPRASGRRKGGPRASGLGAQRRSSAWGAHQRPRGTPADGNPDPRPPGRLLRPLGAGGWLEPRSPAPGSRGSGCSATSAP